MTFQAFFPQVKSISNWSTHLCAVDGNDHSYLCVGNGNIAFYAFIILKNLYVNQLYILDDNFHYISF